jgi:ubiquinone/menaquinone biosynthesis C-methylase UbiE
MSQSVERFSSRVESYAKYRPGYPNDIVQLLEEECGLRPQSIIADIGSGTGKLSEVFLANGNPVVGVEPNSGMRAAAERILRSYSGFKTIDGTAEATTLPDSSVDFVTAGQAFHWFNPALAKVESARILKPEGWVVLVWNDRKLKSTPFLENYEALLMKYGTDYGEVRHDKAERRIADFFAPATVNLKVFPNEQVFDFAGLTGRVLSSSYTPEPQHPTFEPMLDELRLIFDKHQSNGYVVFDYDTKVYYGRLR